MSSTTIGGTPVTTAYYARFSASLVSSFVAAMIGGVVMALVMVVAFGGIQHQSALYPLRSVGTFLYGDVMLVAPTTTMYLAALAFHFGVCALWGIIFAFAATLLRVDMSVGGSLALGIVIGLCSNLIDINMVTPALMQSLWGQDLWTLTVPPRYTWLAHVAFGLSFALAPLIFRRLWLRFSGRQDLLSKDPHLP